MGVLAESADAGLLHLDKQLDFRTVTIRQGRTVSSEWREPGEMNPGLLPESFLLTAWRGEPKEHLSHSANCEDGAKSPAGWRQLAFTGLSTEEGWAAWRGTTETCRGSSSVRGSAKNWSARTFEDTAQGQGQNHPGWLEGATPGCSHRPTNSACSYRPGWSTSWFTQN